MHTLSTDEVDTIRREAGLHVVLGECIVCSKKGAIMMIEGHTFCLNHGFRLHRAMAQHRERRYSDA